MERNDFIQAMSQVASTVSVITTAGIQGQHGVTVSAMCSVTADPPTLLVCVHHLSPACEAIRQNKVMCVNLLSTEQHTISDTFAGRLPPPGKDKFSCAQWVYGETKSPQLENALVNFDCKVVEHFQSGTHFIFIGHVLEVRSQETGSALVYANRAYGHTVELECSA